MIRVLVADDQALIRDSFRLLLDLEPDIEVVGEAGNGQEAVTQARALQPDVVLMDVRMPVLDGLAATRALTRAGLPARVLILTTYDADEYLYDAMRAGACGFLLKDVRREQLADAVRTVAAGDALLHPALTRRLVERFVQGPPPGRRPPALAGLTERETEVLTLVGRGFVQRRDRGRAVPRRGDGQDPPRPRADQARPARPGAGRRHRLRVGSRPARCALTIKR